MSTCFTWAAAGARLRAEVSRATRDTVTKRTIKADGSQHVGRNGHRERSPSIELGWSVSNVLPMRFPVRALPWRARARLAPRPE